MDLAVLFVVPAVVMGALGGYVAARKGREPAGGAAPGALFGPFGVLIEALLPAVRPGPGGDHRPRARSGPEWSDDRDRPRPPVETDPAEDLATSYLGGLEPPEPPPAAVPDWMSVPDPESERAREAEAVRSLRIEPRPRKGAS